jgi:aspartate racemase
MPEKPLVPGIIGGAGPGATAQLYLDIMIRSRRVSPHRRPPVLIASLDIDLAMEDRLLREGVGIEGYWDSLLAAARALIVAGADFLAIPCNTLHVLLPRLETAVTVPVLSIVDAVAQEVEAAGCRRVGLLSTASTLHTGLYGDGLRARGIEVVCIGLALQDSLQARIRDEVGQRTQSEVPDLADEIGRLFQAEGADAIVAGCTELKAFMADWVLPMPVIDSLDALGSHIVRVMTHDHRWQVPRP